MNTVQLKLNKRKILQEFVAENDLATTRDESLTTINYAIKTNSNLGAIGRRWPPCFLPSLHCALRSTDCVDSTLCLCCVLLVYCVDWGYVPAEVWGRRGAERRRLGNVALRPAVYWMTTVWPVATRRSAVFAFRFRRRCSLLHRFPSSPFRSVLHSCWTMATRAHVDNVTLRKALLANSEQDIDRKCILTQFRIWILTNCVMHHYSHWLHRYWSGESY